MLKLSSCMRNGIFGSRRLHAAAWSNAPVVSAGDVPVPGDARTRVVTILPGHGCVYRPSALQQPSFIMNTLHASYGVLVSGSPLFSVPNRAKLNALARYRRPLVCSIGPELVQSAMRVLKASNAPLAFDVVDNIVDKVRNSHTFDAAACRTRPAVVLVRPAVRRRQGLIVLRLRFNAVSSFRLHRRQLRPLSALAWESRASL